MPYNCDSAAQWSRNGALEIARPKEAYNRAVRRPPSPLADDQFVEEQCGGHLPLAK